VGKDDNCIRVTGAREHNLRDVDLELPKGQLICFTGVSGSGKSSLAFDTLYAEGQRRYVESLSSYARQFIGEMPRPDVDQITGLAPAISIQQKTSGWNPRSTVGTITQIHDYLRVLYARAGTSHCSSCGRPVTAQTREQMIGRILSLEPGTRVAVLGPKIKGQKGEYKDLLSELLQQGFVRARVDGEWVELNQPPELDRYRRHDVDVVIDRLVIRPGVRPRLAEALELALRVGSGSATIAIMSTDAVTGKNPPASNDMPLSAGFACTHCDLSFEPPAPRLFSFNSPAGMCDFCHGLGIRYDFDPELLVPDPNLGFLAPCVAALRTKPGKWRRHIYQGVADHLGFDLKTPWRNLPKTARDALLYGTADAHITFEWRGRHGVWKHGETYDGVIADLHAKHAKAHSTMVRRFYEQFMRETICPRCMGARLNAQALAVRLAGGGAALNIAELCRLPISRVLEFNESLELSETAAIIATEPLKEIRARLRFLVEVGLDYVTLDRSAPTLSGGESQRIRLASQIGCGLVGVLYVLDEPSIGLHARDNKRLLSSLRQLRDLGNTVIVVEHDQDTMLAAETIVDFGPGPGVRGGEIVAHGSLDDIAGCQRSLTGAYLSGTRSIAIPTNRRPINPPGRPDRQTAASD
jgi:excinuclease ABC subunit A